MLDQKGTSQREQEPRQPFRRVGWIPPKRAVPFFLRGGVSDRVSMPSFARGVAPPSDALEAVLQTRVGEPFFLVYFFATNFTR
jgi:hypothetical protein